MNTTRDFYRLKRQRTRSPVLWSAVAERGGGTAFPFVAEGEKAARRGASRRRPKRIAGKVPLRVPSRPFVVSAFSTS